MAATKRAASRAAKPKPERNLRVAYIGNFGPSHSTENHVAQALMNNGHEVVAYQENGPGFWRTYLDDIASGTFEHADFVMWTRTGWDYRQHGYSTQAEALDLQRRVLDGLRQHARIVVGYHLDLWWGLKREHQVFEEPFFRSDLVVTADGGSDEKWTDAGVNHVWFPPGVSAPECEPGMFQDRFASDIAFVGNWAGEYHQESEHRFALVRFLQDNFADRIRFWPIPGWPAVRGADLRDLYASTKVVVGDSCLVGTGHANYWSDRIPETLGRGGFLLHPDVPGLAEEFPKRLPLPWEANDWDALGSNIEFVLSMAPAERQEWTSEGRSWVLANHTYEVRMRQLVELLRERGLISN